MEKQLFDWDEYDFCDGGAIQFYSCRLVQPIGDFPIGTTFGAILVDYSAGKIHLWEDDMSQEPAAEYELQLSVIS